MKINSLILLIGLVIILNNNKDALAGCGDPCISVYRMSFTGVSQNILTWDTLFIGDGYYGNFRVRGNSCCESVIGDINLIWYKDDMPYDTSLMSEMLWTDFGNGYYYYEASLDIYEPGVYKVYYLSTAHTYFNAMDYNCGGRTVALSPDTSATLPIPTKDDPSYTLFPNPSYNGKFYLDLLGTSGDVDIKVFDLMGKEILNTNFIGIGKAEINLADFPTGNYIVRINYQGIITTRKIIIGYSNQ